MRMGDWSFPFRCPPLSLWMSEPKGQRYLGSLPQWLHLEMAERERCREKGGEGNGVGTEGRPGRFLFQSLSSAGAAMPGEGMGYGTAIDLEN